MGSRLREPTLLMANGRGSWSAGSGVTKFPRTAVRSASLSSNLVPTNSSPLLLINKKNKIKKESFTHL